MKKPEVYKELMAELEAARGEGRLSSPPTYAEASKLPYLGACIKEALRVHPGVQLSIPRELPAQGLELCGVHIPAGYRVGMNAAVIHYDRSVFGEDAAEYRPGRWLETEGEGEDARPVAARLDKYMMHFGAGTRTCIGRNISMAEIYKLVPEVLLNFRMEMADGPDATWKTRNLWFCKQTNVVVRLERRQGAAEQ